MSKDPLIVIYVSYSVSRYDYGVTCSSNFKIFAFQPSHYIPFVLWAAFNLVELKPTSKESMNKLCRHYVTSSDLNQGHRKKARGLAPRHLPQSITLPLSLRFTTAPLQFCSYSANMNTDNHRRHRSDKVFGLVCVGQSAWRWIQRKVSRVPSS